MKFFFNLSNNCGMKEKKRIFVNTFQPFIKHTA